MNCADSCDRPRSNVTAVEAAACRRPRRVRRPPTWARTSTFACFLQAHVALLAPAAAQPETPLETIESNSSLPVSDEEFRFVLDEPTTATVDGLIALLGSPSYTEREQASQRLAELGVVAMARLRDDYLATDSLEVRLRIERLVYDLYMDLHVFGRNGFLGIQQDVRPVTHTDDSRVPPGGAGVRITRVIADTAAARAYLREGDIICEIDGQPIPDAARDPNFGFGEAIRVRGPGAEVELTVIRAESTRKISAVLGRRPREYYRSHPVLGPMLVDALNEFPRWWDHHFRRAIPPEGDSH